MIKGIEDVFTKSRILGIFGQYRYRIRIIIIFLPLSKYKVCYYY